MTGEPGPLVECVPNVSEGRNVEVIRALASVIRASPGVTLLHVDPGVDAHRTVFTFAGEAEAVGDAAIALGHAVARSIDMRAHQGAHPRLGALDVCPFVPLRGSSLDRCAGVARRVASTLAHDLRVPIFLYEHAATSEARRSLADVRRGGYEALPLRLAQPAWRPDFGPAARPDRLGAFIVGARPLLIAWNVSLGATDIDVARRIAARVRTSGGLVRGADGEMTRAPGLLPAVRAVGWLMPAYGLAQVSMNLLDFRQTPLHVAYAAVREEAARLGVPVVGSELVGMVPEEALVAAGRHALGRADVDASAAMAAAVDALGLAHLGPFDIDTRVIERKLTSVGVRSRNTRVSSGGS
jgi:glutamate formiminotransferase / formiminotetrahydrofolate cyclodeaminase